MLSFRETVSACPRWYSFYHPEHSFSHPVNSIWHSFSHPVRSIWYSGLNLAHLSLNSSNLPFGRLHLLFQNKLCWTCLVHCNAPLNVAHGFLEDLCQPIVSNDSAPLNWIGSGLCMSISRPVKICSASSSWAISSSVILPLIWTMMQESEDILKLWCLPPSTVIWMPWLTRRGPSIVFGCRNFGPQYILPI